MQDIRGQISTCKGGKTIDDGKPTVAQAEQIGRIIGVIMKHSETYKLLSHKYGIDSDGGSCEIEDVEHVVGTRQALVFVIEKLNDHTPEGRESFYADIDKIILAKGRLVRVTVW